MKAIVQDEYGNADVLRLAEIARPVIAADEVLIRVQAAGVDRGTVHLMTGLPYLGRLAFGLRTPRNPVLGLDVSGVVVEVGSSVTRFEVGDEVFGIAKGSFAEFAAAHQDKLAIKPKNLSFEEAAVVPVSGLTALQALTDQGRLEACQKVLIIGASGGVGTYAVQLAKALDADVTGVASTSKLDLIRSLGADNVIDYTTGDFSEGTVQYDLILDIGGNSPLKKLRKALAAEGTLVIVGGEGGGPWFGGLERQLQALALTAFVGQRLITFLSKEHYSGLERLVEMIEAGKLTPSVGATYPLNEVPDAIRHLENGQARGKLAVSI